MSCWANITRSEAFKTNYFYLILFIERHARIEPDSAGVAKPVTRKGKNFNLCTLYICLQNIGIYTLFFCNLKAKVP